jgi:hypothetical protein
VVPVDLLTSAPEIAVTGAETSGEAECVFITSERGLLVGIGSDHTDRALERIDVDRSKAVCPKVVGRDVWRYEDLIDHWDALEIRAWSTLRGVRRLYQEGTLAGFMEFDRLTRELADMGHPDGPGRVLFGGTLPLHGGFEYGERSEAELHDPILDRTLRVDYRVRRAP